MEPFTTGMDSGSILFQTLPLWMSFIGLELEHHSTEAVSMIASATGVVNQLLPVVIIPCKAEGYRAQVKVDVNYPLVQGTMVNTLSKGDVWVAYKFNGLSSLYCIIFRKLSHERNNCQTPTIVESQQQQMLFLGYHEEQQTPAIMDGIFAEAVDQRNALNRPVWPHDFGLNTDMGFGLGETSNRMNIKTPDQAQAQQKQSPQMKCQELIKL
ncbi:hypothetical protein FRX31_022811 [Thalictrum thalictroides]|uniref:Uncharacterized protein n=1 Tax=Thalictrum thalictroides TaxID=46969 RepID=A0A7J6VTA4_THATH|nr:hypothetical protein FRX31_022811 [Thalictrum thalictroides]